MRTSTDKLNVSTTSTGPYMFFNDGGTLGTYNTTNSTFPWFIEMSGLASFPNVNCNNLSVKNTKQQVIVMSPPPLETSLLITSPQMIYINSNSDNIYFNLTPLGETCNFNIYEFRLQTSNVNSVMRFRGFSTEPQCLIVLIHLLMKQNKDIIDFNIFINLLADL